MTTLPAFLEVGPFTEERSKEAVSLLERLSSKKEGKRAFQKLHYEFRRRTQSYNPYRIPRRCRIPVLKDLEAAPPVPSKRPRKDRRRPANLRIEFASRSEKHGRWLETHLWHAKRMHMEVLWGYRLAISPTQKSKRKVYRLANRRSVMYDESYFICWELARLESEVFISDCCDIPPTTENSQTNYFEVLIYSDREKSALLCPAQVLRGSHIYLFFHPAAESRCKQLFTHRGYRYTHISTVNRFRLLGPDAWSVFTQVFTSENCNGVPEVAFWSMTYSYLQARLLNGSCFHLGVELPEILGPFPPKLRRSRLDDEDELKSAASDALTVRTVLSTLPTIPSILRPRDNTVGESGNMRRSLSEINQPLSSRESTSPLSRVKSSRSERFRHTVRSTKRQDAKKSAVKLRTALARNFLDLASPSEGSKRRTEIIGVFRHYGNLPEVLLLIPSDSGARNIWTLLSRQGCRAMGLENLRKLSICEGIPLFPQHWISTETGREYDQTQTLLRETAHFKRPPAHRTPAKALLARWPFGGMWREAFPRWLVSREDAQRCASSVIAGWLLEPAPFSFHRGVGMLCRVETLSRGVPAAPALLLQPPPGLLTGVRAQSSVEAKPVGCVIDGEHSLKRGLGTGFGVICVASYLNRIRQLQATVKRSSRMEAQIESLRRVPLFLFRNERAAEVTTATFLCRDGTGSPPFWVGVIPLIPFV
eukprot:Protomagalhaensia_sp_Gyna_25__5079@NODE_578_length_3074_cov_11_947941_g448_i0_p1_GENE_NODE_578_length_3074_cov_11_947941_g448_i0NODE_578_length_3074_cov_11_947941_g448_i0_p1_ORF_typecomplete_len705_score56_80POP1/PF06978_11/2_2e29POP1/PF06978_11/5_1e03POPLD/PF08170_12/1_5e04POPLD/PF08170_12/1_6e03POPLD/PF08170_12/2_2e13_NODE_578_length_3074_cov_11_947941_g448_i0282142